MRVLVLSQYFWPESFRINDLVLGLKDRGHDVSVLTGIPNYPDGRFFPGYGYLKRRKEFFNGIRVVRVPLISRGGGGSFRLALNFISFAFFASILAPFYFRGCFDIVFVYEPSPITVGLPAVVLRKLKSLHVMFWMQDLWPESLTATGAVNSKTIIGLVGILVRFILKRCDVILVQSRAFFAPVEANGVKPDKIAYFPNSAEELYKPEKLEANAPERVKIPSGFCVMFAGNIGAAQDFPTILDAADKLRGFKDIHWVVLGDGRMRQWVEQQIMKRNLGDIVHLLGRYPVDSMPRFFSLADAMLVTLRNEPIFKLTIPSKVQSYLACGKPIVAALTGEGARVIKEAEAGMVCPPEDAQALSEAVLSMYRLPEADRDAMGLNAKKFFERHFERTMLLSRLEKWMMSFKKEVRNCAS